MSLSANAKNVTNSHIILLGIAFAAGFLYLWIVPLFLPRGEFLEGHYRLKDIYLGIPVGVGLLCAVLIAMVPVRHRGRVALRLTLASVAVLLTFFVSDAVYALVINGAWRANAWLDRGEIPRRYSSPDPELGFVRNPGVSWYGDGPGSNRKVLYRTDENGFRNPPGVTHAEVVFIGDSFTEAAQVSEEDTYVQRVGAVSGLSTVNLGRGAYGPQQELIVLQKFGLAYQPKVVVWQLFDGNDLLDARIFAEWKANPDQVGAPFSQRYFANSLLGELVPRRPPQPDRPLIKMRYSDGSQRQLVLRYEYDPNAPANVPLGFRETIKAVETGYRLCQERGIKLILIFMPTMIRVMEPYVTFEYAQDRTRPANNTATDKNDFAQGLAEFCASINCHLVDTLPALRQAAANDNRQLYIPLDEHLGRRGHEVITQVITEWMRTQKLTH